MKNLYLYSLLLFLLCCEKNNPDKISKIDCIAQIAIDEISEACMLCKSKYDEFKREDKEDLWEYYIQHKEEVCFPERSFKVKETFEEKDMFQSEVNSRSDETDYLVDIGFINDLNVNENDMNNYVRDMSVVFDLDRDVNDLDYWGELQDLDEDGVYDVSDNCGVIYNPNQENIDGDAFGDACDLDIDADGIFNEYDNCPYIPNTNQLDTDNDSIGDVCDEIDNSYMPIEEDLGVPIADPDSNGSCEDPVVINTFNTTHSANLNQLRSKLHFNSDCRVLNGQNQHVSLYTAFGSEVVFYLESNRDINVKVSINEDSVLFNTLFLYKINNCNDIVIIETEEQMCDQYNDTNFKSLNIVLNAGEPVYLVLDSGLDIIQIIERVNIENNPEQGFSIKIEEIIN